MHFLNKLFGIEESSSLHLSEAISKGAFLVDVRTPQEFAESTAKGAVNIPLHELEQRLIECKDKQQIVVFCRSGNRSAQAAAILKRNGFTHVINGGSWQEVNKLIQEKTK